MISRLVLISAVAHEIGHFFGLEDEYCSNQAGSSSCYCNDGGDRPWYCLSKDINYLRRNLGCDPTGAPDPDTGLPCCNFDNNHLCSNVNYDICCYGNKNPYGGRETMSYANVELRSPGDRGFDILSIAHLNTKLRCD